MIEIAFSPSFKRAFRKKVKGRKEVENLFWAAVEIFVNDPFNPGLKTHKLSGSLRYYWSFSVEYNLRVLFEFKEENTKAVFVDFGTHDDVY